jgi:hypothetical protein
MTQKYDELNEIKARLQSGNKCYYGLSNLLKTRTISMNLKIQLYRTLIRPVVMYGCEVWTLRKLDQNRLLIFERKILRRIFGPCIDETTGEWRIRKNEELKQLYQMSDIIRKIKKKRLQWAGHAWRKEGTLIRMVQRGTPQGKRPVGRPRLRWEDQVRKDVQVTDPSADWKVLALDRVKWQDICLNV